MPKRNAQEWTFGGRPRSSKTKRRQSSSKRLAPRAPWLPFFGTTRPILVEQNLPHRRPHPNRPKVIMFLHSSSQPPLPHPRAHPLLIVAALIVAAAATAAAADCTLTLTSTKPSAPAPSFYAGFTTDWWTANDPRFGAKWGLCGALTIRLQSAPLIALARQLAPALWRVGGTPADAVVYELAGPAECAAKTAAGVSEGPWPYAICVNASRLEQLMSFAERTGLELAFGINGLYQRPSPNEHMNYTNAIALLTFVAKSNFSVFAFELGNELGNGYPYTNRVEPEILGEDFLIIRKHIDRLWPPNSTRRRPLLVGPDSTFDFEFGARFLSVAATAIDAFTFHAYSSSARTQSAKSVEKALLDPVHLRNADRQSVDSALELLAQLAPTLPLWAGEVGPAAGGGEPNVTNTFLDAFWYLDKLGYQAARGVAAFARSTLCGGGYELVTHQQQSFAPNPDLYALYAWKQLMGLRAYPMPNSSDASIVAYASCRDDDASVTILLLNFDRQRTITVHIDWPKSPSQQLQWLFRGAGGHLHARQVELQQNGGSHWQLLALDANYQLPPLTPSLNTTTPQPITLPPLVYAFVKFPGLCP